jgi:hypothetical protein
VELEPALAPIADQLAGAVHSMDDATGDAHRYCAAPAKHSTDTVRPWQAHIAAWTGLLLLRTTMASFYKRLGGPLLCTRICMGITSMCVGRDEFHNYNLRGTCTGVIDFSSKLMADG